MFQEQENNFRREIDMMSRNIDSKEKQLRDIKRTHQREIEELKAQSEERVKNLKDNFVDRNREVVNAEHLRLV